MKLVYSAVLSGCLMGAGCADPLDRRWDHRVDQDIRERYESSDARLAQIRSGDKSIDHPTSGMGSLERLSVDDAIRIGIANTPSLRRAGYRVDIAAGRVTQAGLYPNPTLAFDAESLGADAGSGGETSYRIEQEIVLGGKLNKARRVAQADERSAQAEFIGEEFAVASRISRAYFGAIAARERLESRALLIDLSGRLLEAASAKLDAGSVTETDLLRAQIVREQSEIELESARLGSQAAMRALALAMGIEESIDIPLSEIPSELPSLPTQEEIAASTLRVNSRISIAQIAIERARRAHELARAEGTPDLVASIGPRYSDPDDETTLDVGLGIEIPIFDRNQGAVRASIAERLSSAAHLREIQLELLTEVADAWAVYESSRGAAVRYQKNLLPKAERTLELTRQSYESGKADYLRLLDAQQVVIDSNTAYVDVLQRLHESAALLRELAQTDAPWRRPHADTTTQEEVTR